MGKEIKLFAWLCVALLVSPLCVAGEGDTGQRTKAVLYVNSYHPGYAWSDGILDGIRSVLKTRPDVKLTVEYLYTKTYSSQEYFKKVRAVFREKYRNSSVDAVITSDDHALDFVLSLMNELFPKRPLVFCGVDHVAHERLAGYDAVYEIMQGEATKGTLDMALKLRPKARDVYFIGDATKTGRTVMAGALKLKPGYGEQLTFHFIWDKSAEEMAGTLKEIPETAIVIYLTFLKDKNNKTFTLEDSMKLVARNCKAPVYCTWGFKPKLGILGGAIMNGFKQGEFSIETGLNLLDPAKAKSIPKSQTAPLAYMVDVKTFRAHDLKRRLLPERTLFFNQSRTLYDDYKKYKVQVWAIVSLIAFLLVSIIRLEGKSKKLLVLNRKYRSEIAERKRVATAFNESEEKIRTFFLLGKVGMAITSPKKDWRMVNQQICDILGYDREELLKTNWLALTHPDDRTSDEALFNRVLNGDIDSYTIDKRFVRKDGGLVHTTLWLACTRDHNGRVKHFIVHLADNSLRIKAEKEKEALELHLRQQQKMESIGTLAGGVAHEINNPINGIMNYAQLILDIQEEQTRTCEYAKEIIHETERIAKIVKALLTFARTDKESHSPARMADIVDSVLSLIRTIIRTDQILIDVSVPEDLPKVNCRSQQIQQVIMNLVINSRDALNDKYAGYDENKKIIITSKLHWKKGTRWISTIVEDKGKGVDPQIQDRIFDPFFTSKPKEIGTGLGLSISYGIVKAHNGELTVESKKGEYTKFVMDLPLKESSDRNSS